MPYLLLPDSFLLAHGPVLRRDGGLCEVQNPRPIRHKRHRLVHRVELDGIVQEEKQGLGVGIPFHLLEEPALSLTVDRA